MFHLVRFPQFLSLGIPEKNLAACSLSFPFRYLQTLMKSPLSLRLLLLWEDESQFLVFLPKIGTLVP